MELDEVMRTTAAVRDYLPDPVADDILHRILDRARFAGSGGNRQGWRVIVVRDADVRRQLRDLYVGVLAEYIDGYRRGLVPYSPSWTPADAPPPPAPNDYADHLDTVPVLLLVLADLGALAMTDRLLDRPSVVGGASVYPFAQNILLAARAEGLGGVLTTLLGREEPRVAELCGIPDTHALAAMITLGHPVHQPTRLSRHPVDAFTTVDRMDGPTFTG